MIYLISHLLGWLLLTAAFAAVAGWAFAAQRNASAEAVQRRERQNLIRDLIRMASGGEEDRASAQVESERETDAARRLMEIRDGRIAELERALESARGRVDDGASRIAELERRLAHADADAGELARLRAAETQRQLHAANNVEDAQVVDEAAEAAAALQGWRLRYFEQRVRYLETLAQEQAQSVADLSAAPEAPEPQVHSNDEAMLLPLQWRAREAEARAAYLESALRDTSAPEPESEAVAEPAAEEPPFAANADVDVLLRWRLLYLERRVAHLQERAAETPAPLPLAEPVVSPTPVETAPDPDRWKWRARYLEARVRHFEQRASDAVAEAEAQAAAARRAAALQAATPADEEEPAPAPAPNVVRRKPPVLTAARNGAPDDFTLIDEISALQQSTLNALGVFHYDQIAAWTPEQVAWIDNYLRLRGRIEEEEWVEQAAELAREGPIAARRSIAAE